MIVVCVILTIQLLEFSFTSAFIVTKILDHPLNDPPPGVNYFGIIIVSLVKSSFIDDERKPIKNS